MKRRNLNEIVSFVAFHPEQLFIVRCPTFLLSKLVLFIH